MTTTVDHLADLLLRTLNAEKTVKRLARDSAVAKHSLAATERTRLEGKAEGLRIAISYIREALLEAESEPFASGQIAASNDG